MRTPWTSPNGGFSYTTLWLNLAALITVFRYALGDATIGGYTPGSLDPMLPAAVLGALGTLYYGRRSQESPTAPKTTEEEVALADAAR